MSYIQSLKHERTLGNFGLLYDKWRYFKHMNSKITNLKGLLHPKPVTPKTLRGSWLRFIIGWMKPSDFHLSKTMSDSDNQLIPKWIVLVLAQNARLEFGKTSQLGRFLQLDLPHFIHWLCPLCSLCYFGRSLNRRNRSWKRFGMWLLCRFVTSDLSQL